MGSEEVHIVTQEEFETDPQYQVAQWQEVLRRAWIVLQCGIGLWWAVDGVRKWNRVQSGFNKTKLILVVGFLVFVGILANEFYIRSLDMIFMLLAVANYVNFITFCLVIDSCQTSDNDRKWSPKRTLNFLFRLLMHCGMVTMVCLCVWGPTNCKEVVYPWPFLTLAYTIVIHNLYDCFLYKKNYLVKLEKLPPPSADNMRFNKELFKKQTLCLLLINVVFGAMSLTVLLTSYVFITDKGGIHVLCVDGVVWQPLDFVGTIFLAAHQGLIMMQVKMSQQVLYKIPNGLDLFAPASDMKRQVRTNLRESLLGKLKFEKADTMKQFEEADRKVNDLVRV